MRPIALGLSIAAAACGWGDTDAEANPRTRGPARPAPTTSEPAKSVDLGSRGPVAQAQPQGEPLKAPKPVLAEKPAEPEKEKRDLSRELRAAVGMPTDCLRPRTGADVPPKVVVDVEAHLVESGLVTRAYVRASQLEPAELECLQKRVAAVRLAPPIEESPRAVNASLEFKFAAPAPPKAP